MLLRKYFVSTEVCFFRKKKIQKPSWNNENPRKENYFGFINIFFSDFYGISGMLY